MASPVRVRRVTVGGRRLVEVLAAAFRDDPWLRWSLPPGRPDRRPDAGSLRTLHSLFLRTVAFPHGVVLTAGRPVDSVEDRVVGVAVLLPPDTDVPTSPEVGEVVLALHGRRAGVALDADAVIERHRRAEGTWVLHSLAVDPAVQGQGVGSALLAAVREHAGDVPVTLETASASARDFYLRRGFAVTATVDLADGHGLGPDAPTVWLLRTP